MAAIKIRAAGAKAAPKPKAKPKAKAGAKATTRPTTRGKRTTAKPAAKRPAGRPRKTEAATDGPKRNATGLAKTDPKLEARLLKAVTAAGDRRRKAKIEHEESVNALYEVAKEALEAGVSMAKVSDASDISRQWLYKMGEFAGREDGNGASTSKPAAKRAAKSTTKATPAKRTSTRKGRATTAKRGVKATAAKPRTRTRIRTAA
jgi:hypothetical protein